MRSVTRSNVRLSDRRERLTQAAVELLEEHGAEQMTTRKIAQRVGISTMQVYSEFGSMGGLVASVVEAGFALLDAELADVQTTDDPIADLWNLWHAYRDFALGHPHLFEVMYGASSLGGYRRSGSELLQGSRAFLRFVQFVTRAIDAGRLTRTKPYDGALQLWANAHGFVMLVLAGYLDAMPAPETPIAESMFLTAVTGLGDDLETARLSIAPDWPPPDQTATTGT